MHSGTPGPAPGSLAGRDSDLEFITAFVDRAAGSDGALLLSGEAGVGKTVLLYAAAGHAAQAGHRVLRAAGTEFEGTVSFLGLNQLVLRLLGQARGLRAGTARRWRSRWGCGRAPRPISLMLANAALALLVQATEAGPVLLLFDDLPWLDRLDHDRGPGSHSIHLSRPAAVADVIAQAASATQG